MLGGYEAFRTEALRAAGTSTATKAVGEEQVLLTAIVEDAQTHARPHRDTRETAETRAAFGATALVDALKAVPPEHPDYFFWDGKSQRESVVKSCDRVFGQVMRKALSLPHSIDAVQKQCRAVDL